MFDPIGWTHAADLCPFLQKATINLTRVYDGKAVLKHKAFISFLFAQDSLVV